MREISLHILDIVQNSLAAGANEVIISVKEDLADDFLEVVIEDNGCGMDKEKLLEKTNHVVGLNDVSFTVNEGEIFVVMGLSGSGKSTLVRCINRLIEPTGGNIHVNGDDVTKLDREELQQLRRKRMGMVFQSFALFPHMTVLENAAYGLKVQDVGQQEQKKRAAEALEVVGLQGWDDSYPGQLSGGMQQRVGLARALANNPDILLMDEAFSALDPLIRGDMQDELISIHNQMGKTIIFITHDLDEALKLGDRIALMKDGEITQIGTPEEILTNPATDYVARFVENVDKAKVLTAAHIMKKPEPLIYHKDGPRVALHRMRRYGISSIFMVEKNNHLKGLVTAEKAAEALQNGEITLDDYIQLDLLKVDPSTPIRELFSLMAEAQGPAAVTSPEGQLLGVIVRGSILAGLAGGGEDDA